MSAREVWSRAGSRATALYGDARLRHSLPSCQILLPKTHQPSLILPRSPPPQLLSAPSVALEWTSSSPSSSVHFAAILLLGAAPEADVTEVPEVRKFGNNNLCCVLRIIPV